MTYRINAPHFVAAVVVTGDTVSQAAPILGWSVGKEFTYVRDYCAKRGWIVEPQEERSHPQWIELDGRCYEIRWQGDAIARISVHDGEDVKEIRFADLPEILKRLI